MIETLKFVLALLPDLIALIKKLEQQFPESGLGKMKLSLVIEAIKNGVGEDKIQLVEKLVASIVSVFNTFGIFKK